MASSIRVRATSNGDTTEVQALIQHPMDSGFVKDAKGEIIPPHFIQVLTFEYDGKPVFVADWGGGVSKDPYVKFAFKGGKDDGVSVGVRGPVSIHPAFSVDPIEIDSVQITKSVNSEPAAKKSSDTMGMKHRVNFGLYTTFGSINCQLAEKTGFSEGDAEVIKEALISLFENDVSSARPDGSMEVVRLYWWRHNCKSGQFSSAKVHRLLKVEPKTDAPRSIDDYDISCGELPGLAVEVYDGQ